MEYLNRHAANKRINYTTTVNTTIAAQNNVINSNRFSL